MEVRGETLTSSLIYFEGLTVFNDEFKIDHYYRAIKLVMSTC